MRIEEVVVDKVERKCDCHKEPSNMKKWYFTLISVVIFVVVVNPFTYRLVNNILGRLFGIKFASKSGCPTMSGLLIHTIVFALLVRYSMGY
jgi:hypothetical protein